jgi:uncharacterized protein
MAEIPGPEDPAHDLLHLKRVVAMAKRLCAEEGADPEVVIPAAWLHDFVIVPKNDPRRSQASKLAAEAALLFLREIRYPERYYPAIAHAIEAHSFSADIKPLTLEARIVQDADRLDGLGAIGIARCFATSGLLKRSFYSEEDPFCEVRAPSDLEFTTDHFFAKLFKVAETLQTPGGRREGARRAQVMREFLKNLESVI